MIPTLQTRHISKHFGGVKAVSSVTLSFERGKIASIVGPNGSGKTTLINLLSGSLPFDAGVILVSGCELKTLAPEDAREYGITRTFQNIRLFEQMPVLDNILVVLTERNIMAALFEKHEAYSVGGRPRYEHRAREILERVGLWEKRHKLARDLSYGQRKLLEVGRALATDAEIFLFDEPFAGLFPEMVKTVAQILRELKQENKTVILIEHNMDLIRELSDQCAVMHYGSLLAVGAPEEVLSRRDVMEAYLGITPS